MDNIHRQHVHIPFPAIYNTRCQCKNGFKQPENMTNEFTGFPASLDLLQDKTEII
jgi:hypothetical protein